MPIYDAPGGNEVTSPNPAVVIVDKDGVPQSLGGAALRSISRYRNTALSATKQEIKATAGDIYGWNFINTNTVDVFVKFYDAPAADVTVGTTPPIGPLLVPAGSSVGAGLFFQEVGEQPQERFANGITVACVTGIADNSTTTPATPIDVTVKFI